jgi:polysaccharide export outer membrane protein
MNVVQRFLRRAGALFLAAALTACGTYSGSLPPAPAVTGISDYSYLVGAGDTLNVQVARNPELSVTVPVRPDGKVSTPLVEDLVVQGKTPVQIAREIETRLARYVRDPQVTVIVQSYVGPYSEQIRVIGEAAKPQALPFKQRMTLLDVMIAVGGLTDFAAGNRATILRTSEGNKQYSVRVQDLVKGGDISANVEMRPGDVLIIPQSYF